MTKPLADGLELITGLPPYGINCYLMDGVLVDAMSKLDRRRILGALKGRDVTAHALTHAHPDHQGSSHAVCEALGIELWCGAGDVEAMEQGTIREHQPSTTLNTVIDKLFTGPPHPVARQLREGDRVGSFTVLETPGHSLGHVCFWREEDRVLIAGDVLNNQHPLLGIPGLREPLDSFTPDPPRNRQSARRLGELEPSLVVFGHGRPLRDTKRFVEFCASLPA